MAHRLDPSLRVRLHLRVRLYAPIASWRPDHIAATRRAHNQPKQPAGVQREGGVRKRAGTRDCLEVRGLERAARCGTMHRAEPLHPRRVGAPHGWRKQCAAAKQQSAAPGRRGATHAQLWPLRCRCPHQLHCGAKHGLLAQSPVGSQPQ